MKKGSIVNVLFILAIALVLFTPLGFHLKVWVNRVISFSPAPIEENQQQGLSSYEWTLKDVHGKEFQFTSARDKVIFINFWASWCPPCVAEMPDLSKLYKDYKDEVVFLFVARDQRSKVEAFIKKHNYDLPVYYETGFTPEQLNNTSLPTTYLLDKRGNIVVEKTGSASWNSKTSRTIIDGLLEN